MPIVVIGWGSLIWCPGSLRLKSAWRPDGPVLPIEYARISSDGRLTLVIDPGASRVRTYWAISALDTVEQARENLREREDTVLSRVDVARTADNVTTTDARSIVHSWLRSRRDICAAVWTALASNWDEIRGRNFSPEDAVRYLSELERDRQSAPTTYERACEYIRNTPEQVQTTVRTMLREREDCRAAKLPATLFERTPTDDKT